MTTPNPTAPSSSAPSSLAPSSLAHAALIERLIAFRDARDWRQFHSLKNLLLSLSLEAAELLELAQWKGDAQLEAELEQPALKARLEEECADVFLYLLMICNHAGIDLIQAAHSKIDRNAEKYPPDKARAVAHKYTEL